MTAATASPPRIVELRTSPILRLSVHQHVHHASHTRLVFSPSSSITSFRTTHVAAPHTGVTERILVKRLLDARPLDAATAASSPALPAAPAAERRPSSSRPDMPIPPSATPPGRRPALRRSSLQRRRTVESQRLTVDRVRLDVTRVARTLQVRETRWKHGMDVVRLEWRKSLQSPSADAGPVPARPPAPPGPGRTSAEHAASTPAPATPAPHRESALPALAMDRSTLDRLADDVMQRIERRVRIERERRGL